MKSKERIMEGIVEDYSSGVSVSDIASEWSLELAEVLMVLREYKDSCTVSKTFTQEFKMLIANRDACESVTRRSISKELEINPNTIKKACEKYGNAFKEKAQSDQEFTRINGLFSFKECPSCKSKKVNKVDESTLYCMDCGAEHIFNFEEEYIMKVNYEWLD